MNEENNMNFGIDNSNTLNNWNTDYNSGNNGKKTNTKLIILIVAIALGIVIIGGIIFYFGVYAKTERLYKEVVGTAIDDIGKGIFNSEYKTVDSQITLDANVNLSIPMFGTEEIIDLINEIEIKLGTKFDSEDEKIIIDLESDYKKEDLINLKAYGDLKNEKTYIHLGSLLNKYIEMDENIIDTTVITETMEDSDSVLKQIENPEAFIKELKKELLKLIKKDYCSSEKVEIEINGEKVKVTKNTFKLKHSEYLKEMKELLERLKDNKKLVNSLKEDVREDFVDEIEYMLEDLDTDDYYDEAIEFNMYTKGFIPQVVKYDIVTSAEGEDDTKIINVEKVSDNEWSYKLPVEDYIELYGTLTLDENNGNKININANLSGMGLVTLDIGYNVKYNVKIDNVDVSNAAKIDELTQQEQMTLITNLQNSKIYELIAPFIDDNNIDGDTEDVENTINSDGTITIYTSDEKENSITFKVPTGYKLGSGSDQEMLWLEKGDDTEIFISADYDEVQDAYKFLEDLKNSKEKSEDYDNVKLSKMQSTVINNKTFYYATLDYTYISSIGKEYNEEIKEKYVWYQISNDYMLEIELEDAQNITDVELNTILSTLEVK